MRKRTLKTAAILAVVLGLVLSSVLLVRTAIDAADPSTDDLEEYPSVLQSLKASGSTDLSMFPAKIPETAEEVSFAYTSDMGGTALYLKFQASADVIQAYEQTAAKRAVWSGTPAQSDAKSQGVYAESLAVFDYGEDGLPSDLIFYVMDQQPYREDDWNHGEISLVGISSDASEVLFAFQDW